MHDINLIDRVTNRLLDPWTLQEELEEFPEEDITSDYVAETKTAEEIYNEAKSGKKLTDHDLAILSTSVRYAYFYAYDVLKAPFKLGEPAIAKDTWYSYFYATEVLHAPFLSGEPAIKKDEDLWKSYRSRFNIRESSDLPDFPEDDLPPLDNAPLAQETILTARGYKKSLFGNMWVKYFSANTSVTVKPTEQDYRCNLAVTKHGKYVGSLVTMSYDCNADSLINALKEKEAEAKRIATSPVKEAKELPDFPDESNLDLVAPMERWRFDLNRLLTVQPDAFGECSVLNRSEHGLTIESKELGIALGKSITMQFLLAMLSGKRHLVTYKLNARYSDIKLDTITSWQKIYTSDTVKGLFSDFAKAFKQAKDKVAHEIKNPSRTPIVSVRYYAFRAGDAITEVLGDDKKGPQM